MLRSRDIAVLSALEAMAAKIEAPKHVDVYAHLFEAQRQLVADRGRVKSVLAGRRGGKSVAMCALLVGRVMDKPGSWAAYITLTRMTAKRIVWPTLKALCQKLGIAFTANEAELTMVIHGGGTIMLGGADNRTEIEKYRGLAYICVAVDECGAFPPYLAELYRDILRPATIDHKGELLFGGTPGYVLNGFWYDMTGSRTMGVPVHHWTMMDNPHIADAEAELEAVRIENGWTEASPTYVREYLGRWVEDEGALVFPLLPHRNFAPSIPVVTRTGVPIPAHDWRYVIGCDVGMVDDTALAVVAANRLVPDDYVVRTEKHQSMLPRALGHRIRELRQVYPHATVVLDSGGMGKVHAEELTRVMAIALEPAQKTEKASQVRIVRDHIISGRLQVLDGPENDALRDEWSVLGWDKHRLLPNPDQPDHASDATLYALRRLRNYRQEDAPAPLPYAAAEEARMIRTLQNRYMPPRGRDSWDR